MKNKKIILFFPVTVFGTGLVFAQGTGANPFQRLLQFTCNVVGWIRPLLAAVGILALFGGALWIMLSKRNGWDSIWNVGGGVAVALVGAAFIAAAFGTSPCGGTT